MSKLEREFANDLQLKLKKALFTQAQAKKVGGKKVFVVSDDVEDREGEVISTSGWDLKNYKKNPVLLWSHDPNSPMIGHGENLRYRRVNGKKKLTFEPKFHRRSDLSKLISDLVENDWIRGVSVGFMPIEKDNDTYTKQELLEISFVNVPANPNALSMVYAKGYKEGTVDKVMKEKKKGKKIRYKVAEKPYPNEHACRLKDPASFQADSFRRTKRKHDGKEYSIIMGRLKGESTMTEQAYRYSKKTWKASQASSHCKSHKGSFEAAKGKQEEFECECLKCGHKMTSKKHCADIKCPECGGEMRRAERPGPGRSVEGETKKEEKECEERDDKAKTSRKTTPKTPAPTKVERLEQSILDTSKEVREVASGIVKNLVKGIEKRDKIIEKNNKKIKDEFKKLRLEIGAVSRGIKTDKGLENRFQDIEANIKSLAEGLQDITRPQAEPEGEKRSKEHGDKQTRRVAYKALNQVTEVLNKLKDE